MSSEMTAVMADMPVGKYSDNSMFAKVATSASWLPRIQLFSASTNECKQGKFTVNHYGLIIKKDNIIDLTKQVEILPVAWRPKALQIGGDGVIIMRFDPNNSEFIRIAETSEIQNSNCMFGPEFLCWIPSQKRFGTFFMCSKSSRNESPNLKDKLDKGLAATLDSTYLQNKKFGWQSPVIKGCSTPWPDDQDPDPAELREIMDRFLNPPESEIEPVEPATGVNAAEVHAR